jgi:hypothetical protein
MKLTTKFLLEGLFLTSVALILWFLSIVHLIKLHPMIAFTSVLAAFFLVLEALYMKYLENRVKGK